MAHQRDLHLSDLVTNPIMKHFPGIFNLSIFLSEGLQILEKINEFSFKFIIIEERDKLYYYFRFQN